MARTLRLTMRDKKSRKKMIMGADTLLCCKPFVLSARLGLGPCKPSQRLPTLRR
jgi:hypothetical protein